MRENYVKNKEEWMTNLYKEDDNKKKQNKGR